MSSTEWELLVIADDIEPGDYIEVELEDGTSESMVFVSDSKSVVRLRDTKGNIRKYSTGSLEELNDGGTFIVRKAD